MGKKKTKQPPTDIVIARAKLPRMPIRKAYAVCVQKHAPALQDRVQSMGKRASMAGSHALMDVVFMTLWLHLA